MDGAAYYRATSVAQLMLQAVDPNIVADGKWGRYTQSVFDKAPVDLRAQIEDSVNILTRGEGTSSLRSFRETQRGTPRTRDTTDRTDIKDLIREIADREGVPLSTAMKIAFLESRFKPDAVSPTGAKGVYQLTTIARKDIQARGGYTVNDPFDPRDNITGGIKYIKIAARDIGARLDEAWKVYMAFNIGPSGARAVLGGNPDKVAKLINQQAYGPPDQYQARLTAAVEGAPAA